MSTSDEFDDDAPLSARQVFNDKLCKLLDLAGELEDHPCAKPAQKKALSDLLDALQGVETPKVPQRREPQNDECHVPKKLENLLKAPLGNKSVLVLPGIGKKYEEKLKEKGYSKAFAVYDKFLELKKESTPFIAFMKAKGIDFGHAQTCYSALLRYDRGVDRLRES